MCLGLPLVAALGAHENEVHALVGAIWRGLHVYGLFMATTFACRILVSRESWVENDIVFHFC